MAFVKLLPETSMNLFSENLAQGQKLLAELVNLTRPMQIRVDLPGIDEMDLDISLVNGVLTIAQKTEKPVKTVSLAEYNIIAINKQTEIAYALAERMALTADPVVIYGTIGTGKHLFARKIHELSPRKEEPFIWLSCILGQGPDYLAAELDKAGSGTVYLDCMNELAPECLKVIKMASSDDKHRKYRFIAGIGQTREQLYRHPNEITELLDNLPRCVIELPSLTEREDEIEPLANYHLERLCAEQKIKMKQLSPEFIQALQAYSWPGNIRELVNTLEQVVIISADKRTLFARDLPNHIRIQAQRRTAQDKKGL